MSRWWSGVGIGVDAAVAGDADPLILEKVGWIASLFRLSVAFFHVSAPSETRLCTTLYHSAQSCKYRRRKAKSEMID